MPSVLVIDDSSVDRALVRGLLSSHADLQVRFSSQGTSAVQDVLGDPPDIVVTDIMMPETDGLCVVQRLRRDRPEVPVVVMTSQGTEEMAIEALRNGACSFVPKSRLTDQLYDTIRQILDLVQVSHAYRDAIEGLADWDIHFRMPSRLSWIPQLVDLLRQTLAGTHRCAVTDAIRFSLAVEEALLNALVHGNLEMTQQMANDADFQLGSRAFLEQCEASPFRDRRIDVRFYSGEARGEVIVRDEGPGFDVRQHMGSAALATFHGGRGRGFTLMRAFTDELHFSPEGNEVRLVKHFRMREVLQRNGGH